MGAATRTGRARNGVARVIVHYGGDREGAEQTASLVQAAGAEAEIIEGDLSTTSGIQKFIAELVKPQPEIDILINNAGSLVERARLAEYTGGLFDQVMNLNVKSVYFIPQAVAPHMMQQGHGVVINLSSIAARNGGDITADSINACRLAAPLSARSRFCPIPRASLHRASCLAG